MAEEKKEEEKPLKEGEEVVPEKTDKKKKKKKPKEDEGTAWWEYCLIFAVLSYKIYTPLPEPIEDRYSRSVALFLNKAVYKVGHFIRIVSPSTETAYLEAAWSGISNLNNYEIEGVTDKEIDFEDFKLFFFTPDEQKAKPNGAIYYIHGGVHQSLDFSKRYLREMAKSTGATVIAPDYRRAPINQFPGPFDDCLAGITHVVRHAEEFDIDPKNIVLSGDSFGAQMALSIAFVNGNLFKKVSINNPPTQNVLLNLPSHQNNKYFMISDIGAAWYWSNLINGANSQKHREYLKNSNYLVVKKKHKTQFKLLDPFLYFKEEEMIVGDGKPWRAPEGDYMAQDIPEWMPDNVVSMIDYRLSPLFASQDLIENAPETYIFSSEFDIFNNDAFMMAKRMTESGVTVHVETTPLAMHNEHYLSSQFWGFSTMIPSADKAVTKYFKHLKSIV